MASIDFALSLPLLAYKQMGSQLHPKSKQKVKATRRYLLMRKRSRNCSAQLIFRIFLFHYLLLILESDKDYKKTSQIVDIFPITLRLSPKVNFWS